MNWENKTIDILRSKIYFIIYDGMRVVLSMMECGLRTIMARIKREMCITFDTCTP